MRGILFHRDGNVHHIILVPPNPCACYINTGFFGVNSKYISSAVHLHFQSTRTCPHLTATVCLLQPCLTGRASCASRRAPTVRPLAARAMRLPTATSPATCSSAAAMTPVSAAASTKTTCARRREASVFPRPTAAPSPTLTPPVSLAPLASAACQTQLPVMAAMTLSKVRATETTTVDKETRVLAADRQARDLAADRETMVLAPDPEVAVPTVVMAVMAVMAVIVVTGTADDITKQERTFHPGLVVLLTANELLNDACFGSKRFPILKLI